MVIELLGSPKIGDRNRLRGLAKEVEDLPRIVVTTDRDGGGGGGGKRPLEHLSAHERTGLNYI
jgi:hypothetical protein